MEGSFGNHKQHYGAAKVKARGEKREKIWIFFATMTANAVKMSKKKEQQQFSPPLRQAA